MEHDSVYVFLYDLNSEEVFFEKTKILEVLVRDNTKILVIGTPDFMNKVTVNNYVSFAVNQLDTIIETNGFIVIYSYSLEGLLIQVRKYLNIQEDELKRLTLRSNNLISFIESQR